jgi:hypothetical protein
MPLIRYCSKKCQEKGQGLQVAGQIPDEVVLQHAGEIHRGLCPECGGNGPVDVHTSYRVYSLLIFTSWSNRPHLCCKSCGTKKQLGDAFLSLQFYDLEDIRDEMALEDAAEYVNTFGHGLFSNAQAVQIVDFVERIKDKVNGILIHCEAGVSRSAAVAAAIELMLNGSSDRIFNDRRYSPNLYVYTKLIQVWQNRMR